ncbi:MAG: hypothetical protein K2X81_01875, partial [Candidatus Obscuribacterales bacterium]|nr:hypothetical protein [Candidatus Obscuribacterales bacterium]
MNTRRLMVSLCLFLAWHPSVYANAMVHQNAAKSGSGMSRGRIRTGETRTESGVRQVAGQKTILNPLLKNQSLQNVSLLETNVGAQRPDESSKAQKSSNTADSSDTTDADKDKKSSSKKTWEQKLKDDSTGEIPKNVSEAAKRCSETMAKYWNSWTDGSGVLTIKRIGQLLKNEDITGKQAAALGALADYFYRQDRKVSSLKTADRKDS